MKTIRITMLAVILLGTSWLSAPTAPALTGATQTVQVEATITSSSEWLPVGDEAGHVIGMGKGEGVAAFSDGATAKYSNVSTFDTRQGKGGTSQGYTKFTFDGGSCIFFSWTAELTLDKNGLPSSAGKGTIIKGTGRFEGIKGTSIFSSKVKILPDSKHIAISNATITYTLP